jgi:hypothetical protein
MGCDIHGPFLEVLPKGSAQWEYIAEVNILRDYFLFSLLAGVRGSTERLPAWVVEPRGMPHDASPVVRRKSSLYVLPDWNAACHDEGNTSVSAATDWLADGSSGIPHPAYHSATYLHHDELARVIHEYQANVRVRTGRYELSQIQKLRILLAGLSNADGEFKDKRIVFWFDN